MHFSTPITVLALATTALGLSGEATFYGGNLAGGTCSFSTYTLPAGIYGTALSDSNWDDSAHCGACISVTGPNGNSITAMIVDQCPGCGTNHLDLFPDAFAKLADPSKGVIDTTWSYVDCPISSPIEVHNKEGVSEFWFSMQVVNANKEVSALEVSTDGGNSWMGTDRQTYNFFEKSSGFGTNSVSVKVTSVDGDIVIVDPCPVSPNKVIKADVNFISEVGPGSDTPTTSSAVVIASSPPMETPASVIDETPFGPSTVPAASEVTPTSKKPAAVAAAPALETLITLIEDTPYGPSTVVSGGPKKTPAASPAAMMQSSPSAPYITPASSAPPAASLGATASAVMPENTAPAAVEESPQSTTTSSSTTTVLQTVTISPPKAKPTVEAPLYPTASAAPEDVVTTTIYGCPSSTSTPAGVASSTLIILMSASPKPATGSPSSTPGSFPFTGAAFSLQTTSSALLISVIAAAAALLI